MKNVEGLVFRPTWWALLNKSSACSAAHSCSTLCDPMDYSLPDSSVHGTLQTRMLEWVAISYSKESSWPRDQNPCLLHCQEDSLPLGHLGNATKIVIFLRNWICNNLPCQAYKSILMFLKGKNIFLCQGKKKKNLV